MDSAAAELRRLHRLDQRTRLRAWRFAWLLPLMFAALGVPALALDDYHLAVAYWLLAGTAVLGIGYATARSAARTYGAGEPPASAWLVYLAILAGAVALPSLGAALGWAIIASCGSAFAVATGLAVINGTIFRTAAAAERVRLAAPVAIIVIGAPLAYAAREPVWQALAVMAGLAAQAWATRSMITR